MRLYLIRHPQAEIAPGICYGRSDLALREPWSVHESAQKLATALPPGVPVLSSPLRRCAEFAAALATQLQSSCAHEALLAELDFGDWELQPWDVLPRVQLDAWAADPLAFRGHGGESVAQMSERVRRMLDSLNRLDGQDCIWVTHAGVMKLVYAELLDLPQAEWLALKFGYAELRELSCASGCWSEAS